MEREKDEKELKVRRNYKDGVFRMLFNNEEKARELYEALSGESCDGQRVEIVTLENVIFGEVKNDLAFTVGERFIYLAEQQSTDTPNMPLRMLLYIAREYEKNFITKAIYSKTLIRVPRPYLYVFYNGTEECPVEKIIKLSDAFPEEYDTISVEVVVKVINVNHKEGAEILKRCRTLGEYSMFIQLVRDKQQEGMDKKTAIEESISECIDEGILVEFLKKNGGEIMSVLYQVLTREECEEIREEDGYIRGVEKGKSLGLAEGRRAERLETAAKMKANGMTLEDISKYTNLTLEEIEKIKDLGN